MIKRLRKKFILIAMFSVSIVLLVVLGSLFAAAMPIISGLAGSALSLLTILLAAGQMPINSTTALLALMLSLAVGMDYSLFIVSRHRDQLASGMDAEESVARALATSGSAVVFAGVTVVIALVGMVVAGIPFLTVMGLFAALSVAIEVALALTLLPAMLGWFTAGPNPDHGLLAFRQVSEALGTSAWYLRALRDEGALAENLATVLASSRYAVELLLRDPQTVQLLGDDAGERRSQEEISAQMRAVEAVTARGDVLTPDLGGTANTTQVGEAIAARIAAG